jgi:tRNA(fMet)-specific endonuclease VapC
MRRYLLDTNALGDLINDRRGVRYRAALAKQAGGRIGTGDPALAEVYYGVEYSATRDKNMKDLQAGLKQLVLWPFDLPAVREYGRLAAELRRVGRVMQEVDIMIAAIALTLGNCTVVTSDSDLSAVPGLAVENGAA